MEVRPRLELIDGRWKAIPVTSAEKAELNSEYVELQRAANLSRIHGDRTESLNEARATDADIKNLLITLAAKMQINPLDWLVLDFRLHMVKILHKQMNFQASALSNISKAMHQSRNDMNEMLLRAGIDPTNEIYHLGDPTTDLPTQAPVALIRSGPASVYMRLQGFEIQTMSDYLVYQHEGLS